jgi:predicted ATPase
MSCACPAKFHDCRFLVLTGGPGAGKTAVLEIVRRAFCEHVAVLPEAASIIYGGGFPRTLDAPTRRASQRCMYRVQVELERLTREKRAFGVALCDRGTLDGLAYWPGSETEYWEELQTTRQAELARYAAVIHLRTPSAGYDHRNPLRIESAEEAAALDARIARAWDGHARRVFVDSAEDFLEKVARAVTLVRTELPPCCRAHPIPEIGERSGGDDPCGA